MTVVAFAGHGSIHPDNAASLLNDYFDVSEGEDGYPDWTGKKQPTIYYVFDQPIGTDEDGLTVAFQYSDYADLDFYPIIDADVYGDSTISHALKVTDNEPDVTDNTAEAVVKYLTGRGTLIVLWGAEDSTDAKTQAIVEAAHAADIPVLDLTAGLDSIAFGDQPVPEAPENDSPSDDTPEKVNEPEAQPEGQDEAQQQAPNHLRVDSTNQENTMVRTLAEGKRSLAAQALIDAQKAIRAYLDQLQERSLAYTLAYTKSQEFFFWATLANPVPETDRVPILEETTSQGDYIPRNEPEPEAQKRRGRPRGTK